MPALGVRRNNFVIRFEGRHGFRSMTPAQTGLTKLSKNPHFNSSFVPGHCCSGKLPASKLKPCVNPQPGCCEHVTTVSANRFDLRARLLKTHQDNHLPSRKNFRHAWINRFASANFIAFTQKIPPHQSSPIDHHFNGISCATCRRRDRTVAFDIDHFERQCHRNQFLVQIAHH